MEPTIIHNGHTITAHATATCVELASDMEVPNAGELLSAQIDGGDDQHDGGKDHQLHDESVPEATLVDDTEARPVRKKKPNMR